jgi:uncharacterized protein
MGDRWKILTLIGGLLLALLVAAVAVPLISNRGTEGKIVLAVGGADGTYAALAETYKEELKRHGVKLELRTDIAGADLLTAINDPKSGIDGGIVKGGFLGSLAGRLASVKARERHDIEAKGTLSIARVMEEPIWMFTRGDLPIKTLRDLKGKRIVTGSTKTGSRRIVVQLLRANGVNSENSVLVNEDLDEAATALMTGKADAAAITIGPETDRIQRLLRVHGIRLMDFSAEAAAYTARFPSISSVVLHQGSVEFEPTIPSADITLLTTSAAVVVKRTLHPALVSLLTQAVVHNPKQSLDKAGDPILFFKAGQFPNSNDPEYDMPMYVKVIHKSGELPFLLRTLAPMTETLKLPFAVTSAASAYGVQAILLLIPTLTILLPLFKLFPMAYKWSVRQRLLYWYNELKVLERRLERTRPAEVFAAQAGHIADIERIDHAARRIRVPLDFSDQLYDLRGHIDLVRRRIMDQTRVAQVQPPALAGGHGGGQMLAPAE